ncbi:MAG: phenylalanine--tRNA ligase subunit alpha [Chloroflexi bacterium]|nr:phenylalanine--tRNA ligase subunit alpha [Chloroflexota bacterium]
MSSAIETLRSEALSSLAAMADLAALDMWHVTVLGRKGSLTGLLGTVGTLPREERPAFGQAANALKRDLEAAYEARLSDLKAQALQDALQSARVDVTLPGVPTTSGRLHLSTQTLRDVYRVFGQMGFQVYRAREVETDEVNFQLLNIPPHHPARDMQDTLYTTTPNVILRTHTSPGQIHAMREYCPQPIRVILPGLVFRNEQVTVRSEFMFHQVEGLAVGRNLTIADLKGVFTEFARMMYGEDRRVRFRGSYFPFTEPSIEVDMDCMLCDGKGCRVCKHTGWLEIAGAGMVHPVVLQNGGYDPAVFSGFAFGMGVERPAMLKYGIDDIRYFFSNDIRFLEQF